VPVLYEEALSKIESLQVFGSRPGLERVRMLLSRLGDPQEMLEFIHVAGTNGKGTTCALLASVLQRAGYRTGLFVSPHVSEFRERIQVNGEMIPESDLCSLVETVFPEVEKMASEGEIVTEFELIAALAFLWFASQNCEIVVLEVGLGGRLDATNVIPRPLVSVITALSLDHTKILGDTIEQIAAEKCGIIKPGGVTVCYPEQPQAALEVIRQTCAGRRNQLVLPSLGDLTVGAMSLSGTDFKYRGMTLHLPFLGDHQIKNAGTALAVLEALEPSGRQISEASYREGFEEARFPARLEVLSQKPVVLLDGAHNPGGTAALAEAIRRYLPGKRVAAVMGMMEDKDVRTAVRNLSGVFARVFTAAPESPRAMSAEKLAELWTSLGTPAIAAENAASAFRAAMEGLGPEEALVICGSLYLAGELRGYALDFLHGRKTAL
jgi:dihydrofolate synthase / folylpolyglutamate synthase